jgi:hypothetical protein
MKTYIVTIIGKKMSFVATQAKNKVEAYNKVKSKYTGARKTGVIVSAVHIDYVSCAKV